MYKNEDTFRQFRDMQENFEKGKRNVNTSAMVTEVYEDTDFLDLQGKVKA